jgi:NADH-quinone oxidoreductase subunit G
MTAAGWTEAAWQTLDHITDALISALPVFGPVKDIAPSADFKIKGQKMPRQPHRYSGRTAMHADVRLHEPKPPEDIDSPLAYSMEGYAGLPPAPLIPRYWSPGWNSVQALNKFQQEVGGPLAGGDPGKRLIEPRTLPSPLEGEGQGEGDKYATGDSGKITFFPYISETSKPKSGEQIDRPSRENSGLEELSSYSPAIVEREKLIRATKAGTP